MSFENNKDNVNNNYNQNFNNINNQQPVYNYPNMKQKKVPVGLIIIISISLIIFAIFISFLSFLNISRKISNKKLLNNITSSNSYLDDESIVDFSDVEDEELADILLLNEYIEKQQNVKLKNFLVSNPELDLDYYTEEIYSPLYEAIYQGNYEAVEILLEHGANIDLMDTKADYASPLELAIECEDVEALKLLLDKGADVEVYDSSGMTPLMYACFFSDELVEVLIDSGADINAKDDDGYFPLIYAIEDEEIVKLLLDKGADKTLKDNNENSAYDWAKYYYDNGEMNISDETLRILGPEVIG